MPAETSLPMQREIERLHVERKSNREIATELKLHRTTVARYTQKLDRSIEVAKAPAASFNKGEVEMLQRFLAEGGIADIDMLSQEVQRLTALLKAFAAMKFTAEDLARLKVISGRLKAAECHNCGETTVWFDEHDENLCRKCGEMVKNQPLVRAVPRT